MSVLLNITYGLLRFFAYLFIAKYIFFEKGLNGRKKIIFYAAVSLGIIICSIFDENTSFFIPILALFVSLYMQRKKKSWWVFLLVFPIDGIFQGLVMPIIDMPVVVFDSVGAIKELYTICMSGIMALCLIVFTIWLDKRTSNLSKVDSVLGSDMDFNSHDRKLSKMERLLLYFVGVFESLVSIVLSFPFRTLAKSVTPTRTDLDVATVINTSEDFDEVIEAVVGNGGGDFFVYSMKSIVFLLGVATFFMTSIVIAVVLINNRRSYYHNRVSDIQFNIIMTMGDIVENRDADTGGHIQRTAKYVEIIANQMKLSGPYQDKMTPKFMEDIRIAAPLHDIGKIHVPDSILNFPGRLSDEQFAIMKTHAMAGRNLLIKAKQRLGDFSYLDVSIDMAGYHHEWWDGSAKGYPTGISGERIPLCARIMAVADVFDALTAKRVYKDPMPVEKAIDIILSEKGTHFDPYVIDAFMAAIEQIKVALSEFETAAVDSEAVEEPVVAVKG